MKALHREMVHAICPVDPAATDYYEVTVETDIVIPVERIREALERVRGIMEYQEEIAQRLANDVGARITLSGVHGTTRTTVICDPA